MSHIYINSVPSSFVICIYTIDCLTFENCTYTLPAKHSETNTKLDFKNLQLFKPLNSTRGFF